MVSVNTAKTFWLRHVQSRLPGREHTCEKYWLKLEQLYREPQRSYHNLYHMQLLSQQVERTVADYEHELSLRGSPCDSDSASRFQLLFSLCLWFHDAIYEPRATDNEVLSKDLFVEFAAEAELDESDRDLVSWVILDTIGHKRENGPLGDQFYADLSGYFLDADLGVLCSEPALYDEYAEKIWEEYSFVGRQTYC